MRRVGHVDLQGRASYQPNVIVYPDGRTIAFAGTHGGSKPNPLKGGVVEPNGTMIVDITNPSGRSRNSIFRSRSQAARRKWRACVWGATCQAEDQTALSAAEHSGSSASGYEIWDVTNVSAPSRWLPCAASAARTRTGGVQIGHRLYAGQQNVPAPNRWRTSQSMLVYDWGNPPTPGPVGSAIVVYPTYPKYIRTYGVSGAQPSGTGGIPNSLHGAISTFEHPYANDPTKILSWRALPGQTSDR